MRGVVPLPYPPPPPGLARGVTNATSVSRPILCTLLGDGGDATTSTSAPPATSTDPGPGCGVCARAVTSVSADGRLMNSGDQSDIRLGQRGTQTTTFLMDVAIRCTTPNCSCDCFTPGKSQLRTCDTCKHGWVSHALDKLGFRHLYNCHQVELVQPSIAFDIASLMLYGTQAIPIRLKILLDRLFSVLQHEEVLQVLHGFGWTYEDYARGYILQDAAGNVLDRWILATREEEPLILQQFLRFGETKTISQQLLVQESSERQDYVIHAPRADSDIKKFIDRTNRVASTAFFKHNSVYTASPHGTSIQSLPVTCSSMFRHPSSVSSTHSLSPNEGSPTERNSPLAISPLNKLQNMQPYDFRREKTSPETRTSEAPVMSLTHSTPLSSPTTSLPSLPTLSTTLTNHTSTATVNSDFSVTDGGSDDDTNSAINLSQSSTGHMDSVYAAKKVRHLRKSANPMKRRWNPIVLSTLNTNPSTGKKRVQCHVCLKTFCDKGALKIHFSAVHLREMHKCTVEGCNMMFSSRRSRNRHSANPNPKLHTPNLRRKINPHDGRTSNPFPLIPPSALINFNSNLIPSSVNQIMDRDGPVTPESEITSHMPIGTMKETVVSHTGSILHKYDEDGALPLTKKARVEQDIEDMSNGAEEGMDLTTKDDSLNNRGVRKRKSLNPTKCAVTSDDDLQYVSTDDSSSDTYIDQADENGLLDSKSEDGTSDLADDSKDEDLDKDDLDEKEEKRESRIIRTEILQYEHIKTETIKSRHVDIKSSIDFSKRDLSINHHNEVEDLSENPLRHLESLSLGAFNNMVSTNSRNHLTQSNPVTSGVLYHAPGLGLASSMPSESCRDMNVTGTDLSGNTIVPPASYPPVNNNSDQESDHMSLMPVYRDASIGSNMEIPVDKENPRRCTACGKIFQNHFGVKTHYQNVHLKLMHKCTVEGCNAAFPSKRSRDRHSANLNLHRKLLSTSSDKGSAFFDKASLYPYHPGVALRDEFFSRLYDPQSLSLGFPDIYHGRMPTCGPDGLSASFTNHLGTSNPLSTMPTFHPAFMAPTSSASGGTLSEGIAVVETSGRNSPTSTMSSAQSPQPASPTSIKTYPACLEEELGADSDGKYSCEFCDKKFHENVVLREHYEKSHTQEVQRCSVEGCNKVFLSRRTRTLHEEFHNKKEKVATTS